jgi:hypothetical protein
MSGRAQRLTTGMESLIFASRMGRRIIHRNYHTRMHIVHTHIHTAQAALKRSALAHLSESCASLIASSSSPSAKRHPLIALSTNARTSLCGPEVKSARTGASLSDCQGNRGASSCNSSAAPVSCTHFAWRWERRSSMIRRAKAALREASTWKRIAVASPLVAHCMYVCVCVCERGLQTAVIVGEHFLPKPSVIVQLGHSIIKILHFIRVCHLRWLR